MHLVINNATAPGTESAYNLDSEMDPFDKAEKERDSSGFFARFSAKIANIHSRREARLVRDEIILSRIPDKDLMEYLKLEQKRLESQQHAREIREKKNLDCIPDDHCVNCRSLSYLFFERQSGNSDQHLIHSRSFDRI